MYPLCNWGHAGIKQRFIRLLKEGFEHEVLLASVQVIEQTLKPVLRSELANQGLRLPLERKGKLLLEEAKSLREKDELIAIHAQSLSTAKEVWKIVFKNHKEGDLAKVIDAIAGANSSHCLFHPTKIPEAYWHRTISEQALLIERGERGLICGLSKMRHKLVHAPNAPDRFSIEALAPFGVHLATSLIDREEGLVLLQFRDPLLRCQPFKKTV